MANTEETRGLLVDIEQQQEQQQQQQQQPVRPSFETGVSFESASPATDDGGSYKESSTNGGNNGGGGRPMSPTSQPSSAADTARPHDQAADDDDAGPPRYSGGDGEGGRGGRHFMLPGPVTSQYGYVRVDRGIDDNDDPLHVAGGSGAGGSGVRSLHSGGGGGGMAPGGKLDGITRVALLVPRIALSLVWFSLYVAFGVMSVVYLVCWVCMQAFTGFTRVEWDKRMVRRDLGGFFDVLMDLFERIW